MDAVSRAPVKGAQVGIRGHPKTFVDSDEAGLFRVPAERRWGFLCLIFADAMGMAGGRLEINAEGYLGTSEMVICWADEKVELKSPLELYPKSK